MRRVRRTALCWTLWGALSCVPILSTCSQETGPATVAWNRQACAQCRMLVGEPAFAAQIRGADGRPVFFDDPGCLLLYRDEHADEPAREIWLHSLHEDRWIPLERASFHETERESPMGYGLGVIESDASADPGMSAAEALEHVHEIEARRRRPGR